MRFAVIEILPPSNPNELPIVKWVATDLCPSSADAVILAWGYQASQKGGYMEWIEDTQEAFDTRKREVNLFFFYSRRTLGKDGKPVNKGD